MSDLTPAARAVVDWLSRHISEDYYDGISNDDFPAWARELVAAARPAIEAEVRREFVQFHDPFHCHYCSGWDYSPPCPYVAAGARAESECTVTPGQEEEIRADERAKVLADLAVFGACGCPMPEQCECSGVAVAAIREQVAREIEAARPHIPPSTDPGRRSAVIVRSALNRAARIARGGAR